MVSSSLITVAVSYLALFSGISSAASVPKVNDFDFEGTSVNPSCPGAGGKTYTAPNGDKFGILCGWDTNDVTYQWGPYFYLSFKDCLCKCADKPGCTVATFTGTCYLKESAKGQGFIKTDRIDNWTAIKLNT